MKLERTKKHTQPGTVVYAAEGTLIELNSSQWLEIQTGEDGGKRNTIFYQNPPPGKRWDVYINLSVVERDE